MKHNFTIGKFNSNYEDPIIPRIKFLKYKNGIYKPNDYYNINTFSNRKLINHEIKKYFKSFSSNKSLKNLRLSNDENFKQNLAKHNNSLSLSNKLLEFNSKKNKISLREENRKNPNKNIIFRKYNYIESLKLKINKRNKTNFNIFFDKENFLLLKSFNNINDDIRKNINQIIIKKKNQLFSKSQLNEDIHYNSTKKFKIFKKNNNKKNNISQKDDVILTNPNISALKNIKNSCNSFLNIRNSLNSINSRICFPYYIKYNFLINFYSNKNLLEFKKYIQS